MTEIIISASFFFELARERGRSIGRYELERAVGAVEGDGRDGEARGVETCLMLMFFLVERKDVKKKERKKSIIKRKKKNNSFFSSLFVLTYRRHFLWKLHLELRVPVPTFFVWLESVQKKRGQRLRRKKKKKKGIAIKRNDVCWGKELQLFSSYPLNLLASVSTSRATA